MPGDPVVTEALARDHKLSKPEYDAVLERLGRAPTYTELGVVSVMFSEHCSYKSSRVHLARLPTTGPRVIQGPGENAGVVDIGDGFAAVFKMESHNHPSFIEPHQGAATGVGGILRDVFTMGARPIASLNSLRFGRPEHPRTPELLRGVVTGVGGYGNCIGVPTVGGELFFDKAYDGNILVNAFTCVVVQTNRIFYGRASGTGNPVLYVGARTGRDGIHGATMASDEFSEGGPSQRPTVQVGDPFLEKLLLEACLEIFARGSLVGVQDMGAARRLYESAALRGDRDAQHALAFAWSEGHGGPLDADAAIRWYRASADQGALWSLDDLGVCLRDRDPAQSLALSLQAAERGYRRAMLRVGILLRDGRCGPRDPVQALRWLFAALAQRIGDGVHEMHALGKELADDQIHEANRLADDDGSAAETLIATSR